MIKAQFPLTVRPAVSLLTWQRWVKHKAPCLYKLLRLLSLQVTEERITKLIYICHPPPCFPSSSLAPQIFAALLLQQEKWKVLPEVNVCPPGKGKMWFCLFKSEEELGHMFSASQACVLATKLLWMVAAVTASTSCSIWLLTLASTASRSLLFKVTN